MKFHIFNNIKKPNSQNISKNEIQSNLKKAYKKLCRELTLFQRVREISLIKSLLTFSHNTAFEKIKSFLRFLRAFDHFFNIHCIFTINKHVRTLPFIYKFVHLYIFTYIQSAY